MDRNNTLQAIQGWPEDEKIALVYDLWDHIIDSGWQPQPSEELKAELDRRLAAHQADPSNVLTWDEVVAHVRRPR